MTTHIIVWRRLDLPGHEIARLDPRDDGWALSGTAVFSYEQQPSTLDYLVICGADWRTRSALVKGTIGHQHIDLAVSVDVEQRWTLNGADCPTVTGCTDIDLGFSPSTNLLPIRRLSLPVGVDAEVNAAWLPFPSLDFELLPQVYRREGERVYGYESDGGNFRRTLDVSAIGFVTRYPGLWEAESAT